MSRALLLRLNEKVLEQIEERVEKAGLKNAQAWITNAIADGLAATLEEPLIDGPMIVEEGKKTDRKN